MPLQLFVHVIGKVWIGKAITLTNSVIRLALHVVVSSSSSGGGSGSGSRSVFDASMQTSAWCMACMV